MIHISFHTNGRQLLDITAKVRDAVRKSGHSDGLCTLFIRHTSASLVISENADPDVLADMERFFSRLVPDGDPLYRHDAEGPDDMPAHVRSALTATSLAVPFEAGELCLGTWQAIYLYEHRHAPHTREVVVHIAG